MFLVSFRGSREEHLKTFRVSGASAQVLHSLEDMDCFGIMQRKGPTRIAQHAWISEAETKTTRPVWKKLDPGVSPDDQNCFSGIQ